MLKYFDDVLSYLTQRSPDAWEIYCEEKTILRCGIGPVNSSIHQQECSFGFAVRIWLESKTGFAFTTEKSQKARQRCVQKAFDSLQEDNRVNTDDLLSKIELQKENGSFYDERNGEDSIRNRLSDDSFWVNEPADLIFCVAKTIMHEKIQWTLLNSAGGNIRCRETLWRFSGQWRIGRAENTVMLEDSASSHFFTSLKPSWPPTLQFMRQFLHPHDAEKKISDTVNLFLCPQAAAEWLGIVYQQVFTDNMIQAKADSSAKENSFLFTDDRTCPLAPGSAAYDRTGFPTQKVEYQLCNFKNRKSTHPSLFMKPSHGFMERNDRFYPYLAPGNFHIPADKNSPNNLPANFDHVIWIFRLFLADESANSGALGFEGFYLRKGQSVGLCAGIAGPLRWTEWIDRLQLRCNDLFINRRIASPSLLFENIPVNFLC